jgi:hypothetical protein
MKRSVPIALASAGAPVAYMRMPSKAFYQVY